LCLHPGANGPELIHWPQKEAARHSGAAELVAPAWMGGLRPGRLFTQHKQHLKVPTLTRMPPHQRSWRMAGIGGVRGFNDTTLKRGTVAHWEARLARDNPELAEEVRAGNLSANAAAIKAGFRRKPSPFEQITQNSHQKSAKRLLWSPSASIFAAAASSPPVELAQSGVRASTSGWVVYL
jgi:hypothetical protein